MAELENRNLVEEGFIQNFQELSDRHRAELKKLLGNPPDIRNVPPEFWAKVKKEEEDLLNLALLSIFIASATQHGQRFGLANSITQRAGSEWAAKRARIVADQRQKTTQESLKQGQQDWFDFLRENKRKTVPREEIEQRLDKIFGKERNLTTVVSEGTNVATSASEFAIKFTGRDHENDTWFTERDEAVCPICAPFHRTQRAKWTRYFPDGPPVHPRCRCYIVYVADREAARPPGVYRGPIGNKTPIPDWIPPATALQKFKAKVRLKALRVKLADDPNDPKIRNMMRILRTKNSKKNANRTRQNLLNTVTDKVENTDTRLSKPNIGTKQRQRFKQRLSQLKAKTKENRKVIKCG